jgi:DNA-nicking Smr family endonuclease
MIQKDEFIAYYQAEPEVDGSSAVIVLLGA